MRKREKLLLLLITITLALGALVYVRSLQDQESLLRFRWLVLNHPLRNLAEAMASVTDVNSPAGSAAVWYGGLSLLAIIIVGIALKSAGNAEVRAFRERLVKAEVAKAELETLLQDAMWKEKHARSGKEAAVRDLEEISNRMLALEDRLHENERAWKHREAELSSRRIENAPPTKTDEKALSDKLRQTTELLREKEFELTQLQNTSGETIAALQARLTLKDASIEQRYSELEVLRGQLAAAETAMHEAQSSLAGQISILKQALKAKDAAIKELERSLTAKLQAVEAQATADRERLQSRSTDVEALRSEVDLLRGKLADAALAKQRADDLLEQEIKNKTELLNAKDRAFKELQDASKSAIQALQAQLVEQKRAEQETTKQLEALRSQMAAAGDAKNSVDRLLAEELRKEKQAREAQAAAMKEREIDLAETIDSLSSRLKEKEDVFQSCTNELEAARSKVNVLTERMANLASAKDRAEGLLEQELKNKTQLLLSKDAAFNELQSRLSASIRNLENHIKEKDTVLQHQADELNAVKDQLTNVELGKQEAEERLLEDLRETKQTLQAKERAIEDLETRLAESADATRKQISEQERLLNSRDREVEALRSDLQTLQAQLEAIDTPGTRSEGLDDRGVAIDSAAGGGELNPKSAGALQSTLREKEDLLKIRDEKIVRLEAELKEKRTELAKHEIAVWQAYERRALWKQRLAKFGISVKD